MKPLEKGKPRLLSNDLTGLREGRGDQIALYTAAKLRQEQVASWMVQHCPDLVNQAARLSFCGSWLWFHDYFRLNLWLLRGGCTCKQHLLCDPCGLRRSATLTKTYLPVVKHLIASNPGWRPCLITRTLRNGPDLGAQHDQFRRAFRAQQLRRRQYFHSASSRFQFDPTILIHIHGGAGSYEFKRGRQSGLWHFHSHEIALISYQDWNIQLCQETKRRFANGAWQDFVVESYRPVDLQERLRQEWSELTGGSWVCDVRMIAWGADGPQDDEDALFGAVAEVMGYCLKASDLTPADRVEAYRVLRRRKMTYTWGCLRGVELPDEAYDDDKAIPADEPWIEREYRWWRGRYDLHKIRDREDALFDRPSGKRRGKASKHIKDVVESVSAEAIRLWILQQQEMPL